MKVPACLKDLGYSMPAEWHKHEATWLSWPKDPDTFPPDIIEDVEDIYCQMIAALQQSEKVKILVNDITWEEKVCNKLEARGLTLKNVLFYHIKSIDVWIRDYAPIFVLNKKIKKKAAIKWIFNAWGGKYDDLLPDNKAGEQVAEKLEIFKPNIILEGGSIDVNSAGTLLTTEQCLLNKNRNPQLTKAEIEKYLYDYLGVDKIIWLKEGIEGDDTDGHVDDITRFVNKNTVVSAVENNKSDANHKPLKENIEILKKAGLNVVELPMPSAIRIPERRLPASYTNFYIGNECILLPTFKDKNDDSAISILQECFPKRKIVPIYARDLVYGYGGIHCVTMQDPKI